MLPDKIILNSDLPFPPVFIPLIEQKTGIKARRFAEDGQCTSDLAIIAAQRCLKKAMFSPRNLDVIILATSSPDRIQPATATRVQYKIGATNAYVFDINSVCSGSVFALQIADSLIKSGYSKNVLVIGAEIYSRFLDPTDFSTYPYFGDGAGAVLLSAMVGTDRGIVHSILKSDGSKADMIQIQAGGTMLPYKELKNPKDIFFKMMGKEVYSLAVTRGSEVSKEIIAEAGIDQNDLRFIITHQANINIIKGISDRLGINFDKFAITLDEYGNTAGASILITLDKLIESMTIEHDDMILLVGFGGGFSWGANLIRY
jgi:3-oxoacyl-[acyl-carrier-protein] synthase-3